MPNVISRKTLAANRRNAAKSTGPASPEAKARVSQNAIRHGFFAKAVVLPGGHAAENKKEFDVLLEQFYADFQPASAFECSCVEKMVAAAWRTRRAYQFEVATLLRASQRYDDDSPLNHLPDEKDADKLIRYESMLDRQFSRAYNQLLGSRQIALQQASIPADTVQVATQSPNELETPAEPLSEPRAQATGGSRLPEQPPSAGNRDSDLETSPSRDPVVDLHPSPQVAPNKARVNHKRSRRNTVADEAEYGPIGTNVHSLDWSRRAAVAGEAGFGPGGAEVGSHGWSKAEPVVTVERLNPAPERAEERRIESQTQNLSQVSGQSATAGEANC